MLRLNNIEVIYNDVILVLKGLSLEVPERKIVALLGTNGAGKSTTLKAISGLLDAEDGEVTDGSIELDGQRLERLDAAEIVRRGIFQVMEGRRVFEHLTCEENLLAGGYTRRDRSQLKASLDLVYRYFPRLRERPRQQAGYLSGGEQQMLAIGRALMAKPRLHAAGRAVARAWRRSWCTRSSRSSGASTRKRAPPSSSWSRTRRSRSRSPTTATSWRAAAWCSKASPRCSPPTRTSRSSTSALTEVGHRKSYRDVKHYKRRKRWL